MVASLGAVASPVHGASYYKRNGYYATWRVAERSPSGLSLPGASFASTFVRVGLGSHYPSPLTLCFVRRVDGRPVHHLLALWRFASGYGRLTGWRRYRKDDEQCSGAMPGWHNPPRYLTSPTENSRMAYTLKQLASDCRSALCGQETSVARQTIRGCSARAGADGGFVAAHFGPDNTSARKILYEDPDLGFCVLSHVLEGINNSRPHDHGPSWAVYAQVEGRTEMTDWRVIKASSDDTPGMVEAVRTYALHPGDAHVYHEGDIHSPRSNCATKLLRIEGTNLDGAPRGYFDPA